MPRIREPGSRPVTEQSNTVSAEKQPIGKPFQPGISGNPRGKLAGTRDTINKAFLKDFIAVWQESGLEALREVAEKQPADLMRAAVALMPKQLEVEIDQYRYRVSDKPATAEEWAAEHTRDDSERQTAH